jgi:Domain of unknown function (DUF4384)
MPIRNPLACTLTLAGAIACASLLAPAEATDTSRNLEADTRDLRPTPVRPGGPARRPEVTLRPSASVVPVGAPVTFEVSSSVDGFGHIYVVSASGRVQVWLENVPIAAGRRLAFPIGDMAIKAAAPPGREDLVLIVTRDRIDGFFGYEGTDVPRALEYSPAAFKRKVTAKIIDLPPKEWGYARTSVKVVDRLGSGWGLGSGSGHPRADFLAGAWEQDWP